MSDTRCITEEGEATTLLEKPTVHRQVKTLKNANSVKPVAEEIRCRLQQLTQGTAKPQQQHSAVRGSS